MIKYPVYTARILMMVFFVISLVIFMIYRSMMQKRQIYILQEKNKELKNAVLVQEKLRVEAQTDALTGLRNKSNVEYVCQQYLNQYSDKKHAIAKNNLT